MNSLINTKTLALRLELLSAALLLPLIPRLCRRDF